MGNGEQEIGITHLPLNLGASPYQPTIELAAYMKADGLDGQVGQNFFDESRWYDTHADGLHKRQ